MNDSWWKAGGGKEIQLESGGREGRGRLRIVNSEFGLRNSEMRDGWRVTGDG